MNTAKVLLIACHPTPPSWECLEMRILFGDPQRTKKPATFSFNKKEQPKVLQYIHDAKNLTVECEQADLLHWHYHLGHSWFKMLTALAIIEILPCCLAKVHTPMWPACSFVKMHQKPWQTNGQHEGKIGKRITRPGQCVSVDQQKPCQVGFFAQLKGRLTRKKYTATIIFVDHCSDLKYIRFMIAVTSEKFFMQNNVLNYFIISIMCLWSTTTGIMGALQTRLLLMMLHQLLCCLCMFPEWTGRKGNSGCARNWHRPRIRP